VLYKNGIGYFEHTARVRGNQDLAIDFTTTQLNDVLKSLTVVDLGEGLIDTVHPSERRLLSYATDTAVHVATTQETSEKPVSQVRIVKGLMLLTKEERGILKYIIRNSDTLPRQVVIEHPVREGWNLAEGPKAEETSASFYRFRVSVEPGRTADLPIEEHHSLDTSYQLTNLNNDQVVLLTQQGRISPAMQDVFRPCTRLEK
jgi:hypothetical protein